MISPQIVVVHVCEMIKGGVATHLEELLRHQVKLYQVSIVLPQDQEEFIKIPDGVSVVRYQYKRSFLRALKTSFKISKIIDELNPNIVHCHSTFAGVMARLSFVLKKKNCRIVYCAHGWSFIMDIGKLKKHVYAGIEKFLARYTDAILNVSEHEQKIALQFNLPVDKMHVVPNFLTDSYSSAKLADIDPNDDKIKLAFIGRFDRQKGFDYLLEEFSKVKRRDMALYIAGGAVLSDSSFEIPKDDRIIYLGWLERESVVKLINSVDAVIMPSRWEGFSIVALEAMRAEKPVLASNRASLPEAVSHNKTGIIFDLKSGELAVVLEKLSSENLKEYGKNGRARFLGFYEADKNLALSDGIYEKVLKT